MPTGDGTRESKSRGQFSVFHHFKAERREIIRSNLPCLGGYHVEMVQLVVMFVVVEAAAVVRDGGG